MSSKTAVLVVLVLLLLKLMYSRGTAVISDSWNMYGLRFAELRDGYVYDITLCPGTYEGKVVEYRALGVDLPLGGIPTHWVFSCRSSNFQIEYGPLPN